jgi:hypothetical protein
MKTLKLDFTIDLVNIILCQSFNSDSTSIDDSITMNLKLFQLNIEGIVILNHILFIPLLVKTNK